jgi:hypothetical protein
MSATLVRLIARKPSAKSADLIVVLVLGFISDLDLPAQWNLPKETSALYAHGLASSTGTYDIHLALLRMLDRAPSPLRA